MFSQRFNVPVCLCNSRGEKWMHHCNWGKLVFHNQSISLVIVVISDVLMNESTVSSVSGIINRRYYSLSTLDFLWTVYKRGETGIYLNASCCSWKLDNWMEPVCSSNSTTTKATNFSENVKTEKKKTAGNNERTLTCWRAFDAFDSTEFVQGLRGPRRLCLRVD